jgi:hypothetical protein
MAAVSPEEALSFPFDASQAVNLFAFVIPGLPQHLYVDLDWSSSEVPPGLLYLAAEQVCVALAALCAAEGLVIRHVLPLVSVRPPADGASLHFHLELESGPFRTLRDAKCFAWHLKQRYLLDWPASAFMDVAVYTKHRLFRLLGHCKPKQGPELALQVLAVPVARGSYPTLCHYLDHPPSVRSARGLSLIMAPGALEVTVFTKPPPELWCSDLRGAQYALEPADPDWTELPPTLAETFLPILERMKAGWPRLKAWPSVGLRLRFARERGNVLVTQTTVRRCPVCSQANQCRAYPAFLIRPTGEVFTHCHAPRCEPVRVERLTPEEQRSLGSVQVPPATALPAAQHRWQTLQDVPQLHLCLWTGAIASADAALVKRWFHSVMKVDRHRDFPVEGPNPPALGSPIAALELIVGTGLVLLRAVWSDRQSSPVADFPMGYPLYALRVGPARQVRGCADLHAPSGTHLHASLIKVAAAERLHTVCRAYRAEAVGAPSHELWFGQRPGVRPDPPVAPSTQRREEPARRHQLQQMAPVPRPRGAQPGSGEPGRVGTPASTPWYEGLPIRLGEADHVFLWMVPPSERIPGCYAVWRGFQHGPATVELHAEAVILHFGAQKVVLRAWWFPGGPSPNHVAPGLRMTPHKGSFHHQGGWAAANPGGEGRLPVLDHYIEAATAHMFGLHGQESQLQQIAAVLSKAVPKPAASSGGLPGRHLSGPAPVAGGERPAYALLLDMFKRQTTARSHRPAAGNPGSDAAAAAGPVVAAADGGSPEGGTSEGNEDAGHGSVGAPLGRAAEAAPRGAMDQQRQLSSGARVAPLGRSLPPITTFFAPVERPKLASVPLPVSPKPFTLPATPSAGCAWVGQQPLQRDEGPASPPTIPADVSDGLPASEQGPVVAPDDSAHGSLKWDPRGEAVAGGRPASPGKLGHLGVGSQADGAVRYS